MASIIYCLIANEISPTPLVEVSMAGGNFPQIAVKLLSKIKPNTSISYSYEDKYMFHHHNESGFTYLCMTDTGFSNRTAYAFLFDIKDRFTRKYGDEALRGIGFGVNKDFTEELKDRINYFNTDPNADKLKASRQTIEKTKDVMIENIDKILERGEKIDILVRKTVQLTESAVSLRTTSSSVRTHMWWKNFKMSLIVCGILIVFYS
jgi:vesicle-associated membrane protein 7